MAEQSSLASRRSSSSASRRKPKKNQIPIGVALVIIIVAIGIYLGTKSGQLALYWTLGISFGVILQKGRFCFTASMRDPYLTGGTSLTRAVLIAFAIATIGFAAIKYGYQSMGLPMPGMSYVAPVSLGTVFGAFIFGIGMVIAGGCASGTLMRVGEGFHMQILSLLFFIIGSLWGAHDFGWWKLNVISKGKEVFLPDVFGWAGALFVQLTIIVLLYIAAEKYEEKRKAQ
ncbi:MAG: YeeE/YedE family protein [Clostridia bacterium]|nr:YeeE/YedE family protein [Clostridia bacterium]